MPPVVKCLVWDLDDTIWDGVALEHDAGAPKPDVFRALDALDQRGILHAVASRGEHEVAAAHLKLHGIDDMFSAVCVGWGAKSESVRRIAETLNIGLDTVAFVDNDAVERAEVAAALPEVRCYPAERVGELPRLPEFTPEVVTPEARQRRGLYRAERIRQRSEQEFTGTSAEFLASLRLVMTVRGATEGDLARAHELTVRTHQLNTTGQTFDEAELRRLGASDRHEVLVAQLRDRFGDYGTIGLAVTETRGTDSVLRLLLTSCRVQSRGAGAALIRHVVDRARSRALRPVAEFVPTEVNRVMLVTLRFGGFEVLDGSAEPMLLAHTGTGATPNTDHIEIVAESEEAP